MTNWVKVRVCIGRDASNPSHKVELNIFEERAIAEGKVKFAKRVCCVLQKHFEKYYDEILRDKTKPQQ